MLRDEGASAGRAATTARDALVHLHLPLVEHCARRFRNRGEPLEDLVQVGTIGLIKSVDRFDTDRGVEFSTYATPTIIGEIKRYFRDKGWAIRVPRRLQELRMQIGTATAELTQSLGRSPTPRELAEAIGCTVEEIVEGIESSNAYSTLSLDATDDSDDGAASMLDAIGIDDEGLEHVEIRESIKPLLDRLEPREKKILLLRFFKNMTQSQIAEEIGVSQMHVSRLLNRTLEQLRTSLEESSELAGRSWRARSSGSSASASMLAGWSSPARTTTATTASTTATSGGVTAAEAPGQARAGSAGPARPGRAPRSCTAVERPGAAPAGPRRTPRRRRRWSAPIVDPAGVEADQLEHGVRHAAARPSTADQRGGRDAASRVAGSARIGRGVRHARAA